MKLHHTLLAAAAAALLAACGDNPGNAPETAPPAAVDAVPASAVASPLAYATYAGSLPKSESGKPLDVNHVTPPTSETEAPLTF